MFERLEDDHGISICYENLGDTYMQMGEIRQVIRGIPVPTNSFPILR